MVFIAQRGVARHTGFPRRATQHGAGQRDGVAVAGQRQAQARVGDIELRDLAARVAQGKGRVPQR